MKTYLFNDLSDRAQQFAYGIYLSNGGKLSFLDFRAVVTYDCIRYQSNGFEA